jgi:hypothetical protein
LFFERIADPDPLKIRAERGSQIADLAPSDIRRILQIDTGPFSMDEYKAAKSKISEENLEVRMALFLKY